MNDANPFVALFPEIYPQRKNVSLTPEPGLVGVMIKSLLFNRLDETLMCSGLVLQSTETQVYDTVHLTVTGLTPVVGYDLDLASEQDDGCENWNQIRRMWSNHFAAQPVTASVLHDDIKRQVNAKVFPLKGISLAQKYMESVRGALTFGDFCPDKGYYNMRDGNTPALCFEVMFGRMYYVPKNKLNDTLAVSELIYDHEKSEIEAKRFDSLHSCHFYKSACIDIETVFDNRYRDEALRRESFSHKFPYCTEGLVAEMTARRENLVHALNAVKKQSWNQSKHVSIPTIASDMPGQQHEITCVSLVILNTHLPKTSSEHRRKKLLVLYNKSKARDNPYPESDPELALAAGIKDVRRITFYPCSGELALLEKMIRTLYKHQIELLYMYNVEFDLRVIEQRVYFYAESEYARGLAPEIKRRCVRLLSDWNGLFVKKAFCKDSCHRFQFETIRFLEMYKQMLKNIGPLLDNVSTLTDQSLISAHIENFNKDKAKLGHFKMNGCGLNVIDLYRMAGTRDVRFACNSMKLSAVAPFLISKVRKLHGRPPKDPRKLCKLSDVSYSRMDEMIKMGGRALFAVLVYNLVDSQLCARLVKVLNPVSALFHRCRTTLNVDVLVHGRGDVFGGFVQSIHSVQIPQLKFKLDSLRVQTGPAGKELTSRLRWDPRLDAGHPGDNGTWKGGSVCDPLTGLHYAGPGMGLELSFDFSSMYPSIMCALNISPETTVPFPPVRFPHDLSGWICYNWEAEGFQYASLILKYDQQREGFVRAPGVFVSSVEHYLNKRSEFKRKLSNSTLSDAERAYYKLQEGECKVLANSFYGTAPHPCGPMISGHGRRQISLVNSCVSNFYKHRCPVVYGDTDSVMVSVGYGPGDLPEKEVDETQVYTCEQANSGDTEREEVLRFAFEARAAIRDKFLRAGADVAEFLKCVHVELVKDTLDRMYVIGQGNKIEKVVEDPDGGLTEGGYPIYKARVPGSSKLCNVTEPFVLGRRVKLEYENSSSVYCHVAKKTYLSLSHNFDAKSGDLSSVSVKTRGLVAFKSMRSPCDSALTDTFIACVMKGDCIKMENDHISCFSTCPWLELKEGDVILYVNDSQLHINEFGRWLGLERASEVLSTFRVEDVTVVELDAGMSAVSVRLCPATTTGPYRGPALVVRTLYKDRRYCMNHIFSRKQAILRDLLACRASMLIASQMAVGFFPWSRLIKSSKNKHFSKQTLDRLQVTSSSVKTSYIEIVRTWLQEITGMATKPVQCYEFYKCKPCKAAFHRYPLNLQAERGCITAMFGGSLMCESDQRLASDSCLEVKRQGVEQSELRRQQLPSGEVELISHPYQPSNKCYSNSRVLIAHHADKTLMNASGKLIAHCIVDYCLPGCMYSSQLQSSILEDCKSHLQSYVTSVKSRLKRATAAFNSIMNNCPEHMIPASDLTEISYLKEKRETVTRLSGDKLVACQKVIVHDMFLNPGRAYENLCTVLREKLERALSEGTVSLVNKDPSVSRWSEGSLQISLPRIIGQRAGLSSFGGKLLVTESELRESNLVELAGVLYQTIIMLQVHVPEAFDSDIVRYPETVLCIMPYSCADTTLLRKWIEAFAMKKWLKPKPTKLGKRTHSFTKSREVTYHCVGCKNFYRDLFANNVSGRTLMQRVYGNSDTRQSGQCVSETRWLL